MDPILRITNLRTQFRGEKGAFVTAVDNLCLEIPKNASVGLLGESGCGKSATALSILRLIPPPGKIDGSVLFYSGAQKQDLLTLSEPELRSLRGNRISMIFQEPMSALNPVYRVGDQIAESLRVHKGLPHREAWAEAVALLRRVGIADPERRAKEHPHQLSGGMRQRVMIAIALACGPDLLIADEPTTALDATIQAQILDLLQTLQKSLQMSILLITHDLGVVSQFCDQVVVMYAGQIVEAGPTQEVLNNPSHPYTMGLVRSIPLLKVGQGPRDRAARLLEIPGMVPPLSALPEGCRFCDRCDRSMEVCGRSAPPLLTLSGKGGRQVRCHLVQEPLTTLDGVACA